MDNGAGQQPSWIWLGLVKGTRCKLSSMAEALLLAAENVLQPWIPATIAGRCDMGP